MFTKMTPEFRQFIALMASFVFLSLTFHISGRLTERTLPLLHDRYGRKNTVVLALLMLVCLMAFVAGFAQMIIASKPVAVIWRFLWERLGLSIVFPLSILTALLYIMQLVCWSVFTKPTKRNRSRTR